MRILLTGSGYSDDAVTKLEVLGYQVLQRAAPTREELFDLLPSLDAYVLGGDERLDGEAIGRSERLKLISFVGTGYGDFVDVAAATKRGIRIANTPSIAGPAVAEHTVGLLLGLQRGLFAHNDGVKRGGTPVGATVELLDSKVGIVGLGDVGTRVARMLRHGFGASVTYHSRTRKPELERELDLEPLELDDLFSSSDSVVLLAPLLPETLHLVGREVLSTAAPGLRLVNTASARLVAPSALRQALDDGIVAMAAFDGYWIEPLPKPEEDPYGLLSYPDARFAVTPHVASKTSGSWERMLRGADENVVRGLDVV